MAGIEWGRVSVTQRVIPLGHSHRPTQPLRRTTDRIPSEALGAFV